MKTGNKKEIWKPSTHPGISISSKGRFRRDKTGNILKQSISSGRLSIVVGTKTEHRYNLKTHLEVAIAFKGHKKKSGFKVVIDHKDNDFTNNEVDNLQLTTQRINASKDKDKTKTSSKFIGVCLARKNRAKTKWKATIYIKPKTISLGYYDKEEDAGNAYKVALSLEDRFTGNIEAFKELIKSYEL